MTVRARCRLSPHQGTPEPNVGDCPMRHSLPRPITKASTHCTDGTNMLLEEKYRVKYASMLRALNEVDQARGMADELYLSCRSSVIQIIADDVAKALTRLARVLRDDASREPGEGSLAGGRSRGGESA